MPSAKNIYVRDPASVGSWGGTCTCPDGSVYDVGDKYDACGSLACDGGVSGTCSSHDPGYLGEYMRVVCDQSAVGAREGGIAHFETQAPWDHMPICPYDHMTI